MIACIFVGLAAFIFILVLLEPVLSIKPRPYVEGDHDD